MWGMPAPHWASGGPRGCKAPPWFGPARPGHRRSQGSRKETSLSSSRPTGHACWASHPPPQPLTPPALTQDGPCQCGACLPVSRGPRGAKHPLGAVLPARSTGGPSDPARRRPCGAVEQQSADGPCILGRAMDGRSSPAPPRPCTPPATCTPPTPPAPSRCLHTPWGVVARERPACPRAGLSNAQPHSLVSFLLTFLLDGAERSAGGCGRCDAVKDFQCLKIDSTTD